MTRRGYALVFILILLVAGIGGIFGARFLLQRLQSDFAPRAAWTPATTLAARVTETVGSSDGATPSAGETPDPTPVRPTAAVLVVSTPDDVAPVPGVTPTTGQTSSAPIGGATPDLGLIDGTPGELIEANETITVTETPGIAASDFLFALARPLRDSTGDCPGSYVLGQVTDRPGNPLPDIRLKLQDEYGNVQYAVSKPGPGDKGFYDFPVTGPPRRMTLMVVGAEDEPLSAPVEVEHQVGDNPDATCHWADWQRR